jgi:hypothetical protein
MQISTSQGEFCMPPCAEMSFTGQQIQLGKKKREQKLHLSAA